MSKVKVFKDPASLLAALRKNRVKVDKWFVERSFGSIEDATDESVGATTFRAFRGLQCAPSTLYRDWAYFWFRKHLPRLRKLKSRQQMSEFVAQSANALRRRWKRVSGQELDFGRAAKLVNLTIKHLLCLSDITERERRKLKALLEVPLDSFTLQGIRTLCPELRIPSNASMGFVRTKHAYVRIQQHIRNLVSPEFAPLDYEMTAWDAAH